VALLLILLGAWYLRAHDPRYATAFMDESIYVLYGRMFFSNHFEPPLDEPLHWSFGWYLWPAMAATADRLGGLVGLREMSALLGMLTVLAIYGFARRLFSPAVGLASAAVFALLGPAVFVFRIATRDAGALFFFAVGLWLYTRAWQEEDRRSWLAAAVFFFAAFLCKYLVALYFPFLVLLGLRRWRQSVLAFALPLALLCAVYGWVYADDLAYLLQYGRGYASLEAPAGEAWKIYVAQRIDFWVLLGLSLLAPYRTGTGVAWSRSLRPDTSRQGTAAPLWLGAAVMLAFQWLARADYDYWKHVNYSLIFLVPLSMEGLLRLTRRLSLFLALPSSQATNHAGSRQALYPAFTVGAVILLAVSLGWAGNAWRMEGFIFWPNVEPIVAIMEGRLTANHRVLVDDSVLRYYLSPPLGQSRITDPFYFGYHGQTGEAAYAAAVRDGYFDYVVLDGGMGEEARRMQAAIYPALQDSSRYTLLMTMPDPVLHQKIEIYSPRQRRGEREDLGALGFEPNTSGTPGGSGAVGASFELAPDSLPRVEIRSPLSSAVVQTDNKAARLEGVAFGAGPGWYARAEVFTNRWYPQGRNKIPVAPDGSFSVTIYLGGEGTEQCSHLLRVRLYDDQNQPRAVAVHYGIARANSDGSGPKCPSSR